MKRLLRAYTSDGAWVLLVIPTHDSFVPRSAEV